MTAIRGSAGVKKTYHSIDVKKPVMMLRCKQAPTVGQVQAIGVRDGPRLRPSAKRLNPGFDWILPRRDVQLLSRYPMLCHGVPGLAELGPIGELNSSSLVFGTRKNATDVPINSVYLAIFLVYIESKYKKQYRKIQLNSVI